MVDRSPIRMVCRKKKLPMSRKHLPSLLSGWKGEESRVSSKVPSIPTCSLGSLGTCRAPPLGNDFQRPSTDEAGPLHRTTSFKPRRNRAKQASTIKWEHFIGKGYQSSEAKELAQDRSLLLKLDLGKGPLCLNPPAMLPWSPPNCSLDTLNREEVPTDRWKHKRKLGRSSLGSTLPSLDFLPTWGGECGFREAKLVNLCEVIHCSAIHYHTCFLPP